MIDPAAWTLLHFLWQGALVWLLASLQLRFLQHARTRYAVACASMLLMLAVPAATFMMLTADTVSPAEAQAGFLASSASFIRSATSTTASQTAWMPIVVWVWASGVALFSVRNAGGLALAYVWRRRALTAVPDEFREAASRLAARFRLSRAVQLRGSSIGVAPSVVGWLRPVIVLPMAALGLPFRQVEALLAHELAHVRRHDFLVNLLQTSVETLLFYHPAVWWLGRRIREEREHCCDDLAVDVCGDRVAYAQALSSLAELRDSAPEFAMAAAGGSLVRRIARLLGVAQPASRGSFWLIAIIAACGVAAVASVALVAEERGRETTMEAAPAAASAVEAEQAAPLPPPAPRATVPQSEAAQPQAAAEAAPPAGTFIRDLAAAGFADLSVDDLVAFKIHNVTGEYVRSLQSAGFKPTADDLVAMRIHNVTPEYAAAMKALGFADLSIDDLVAARIHGVDAGAVQQLKSLGFSDLSFDDVVTARIHNLTPEFVRALRDAGFSGFTFDDAVSARIHGVTPEFVKQAQQTGLKNLTLENLVTLKIHGILD